VDWFKEHLVVLLEGTIGALVAWFHLRQEVAVMKSEMEGFMAQLAVMNGEIMRLRDHNHRMANMVANLQLRNDRLDREE
jgi:hypothetical protein